jgi:Protein of unknown function (DUF4254)
VDVSGVVKIHAPGLCADLYQPARRGASSTRCDTLEIGNELVAQSVEQRTFNAWVVGSIPTELTTFRSYRATGWRALTARGGSYLSTLMATTPLCATPLNSLQVTALHDRCTAEWHREIPAVAPTVTGFERRLAEQHLANFELWHAEDMARAPEASDHDLARIKRFIDCANQRRNDLTEQCDVFLLNFLSQQNLPAAGAELHSESPGLILDRLSILSLKLFHTRGEIDRPQAPQGHGERNLERLRILVEQRDDLAVALDRLWQQVLDRQRGFKLYRQLKMYNDPALNPAVYSPHTKP